MKLFTNCFPIMMIDSCMQSSLKQPAGSQMSPEILKNNLPND